MGNNFKSIVYDNYIYYTICEVTLTLSRATHFWDYNLFCHNLHNSVILNNLNRKEIKQLDEIILELELIYNLSSENAATYIFNFFALEKYKTFEKSVKFTTRALKGLSD